MSFSVRIMCCSSRNHFCFICGQFVPLNVRRYLMSNEDLDYLYCSYFNVTEILLDVWYAPKICCESCRRTLHGWWNREKYRAFTFSRPMIWRERAEGHDSNHCYFCSTNIAGFRNHTRHRVQYKFNAFAIAPLTNDQVQREIPPPPIKPRPEPQPTSQPDEQPLTEDEPIQPEPMLEWKEFPPTPSTRTGFQSNVSEYVPPNRKEKSVRQIGQQDFDDISRIIK